MRDLTPTTNAPQPFAFNKMPIYLWRMGLGPLVGQLFMLVTTTGRRSGQSRRAVVEYFFVNGQKYVMADPEAQWYLNAQADPRLTIQTAFGTECARARRVTEENELTAVFVTLMNNRPMMAQRIMQRVPMQSIPADLVANADKLTLVAFDPTSDPTPPPMEADLRWLTPLIVGGIVMSWVLRLVVRRAARDE